MLKFSESAVEWAMEKLTPLASCRNAPIGNPTALTAHAKALLRIAHPVIVAARVRYAVRDAKHPREYVPTEADLAATAAECEAVQLLHNGSQVNPVDWLIDKALDTEEFYPPPPRLRALFKYWPTADGVDGEDL